MGERENTAGQSQAASSQAHASRHGAMSKNTVGKPPKPVKKGLIGIGVVIVIALAMAAIGWLVFSKTERSELDRSAHQAVFLTDGQVYFGKITRLSRDHIKLTEVFYLNVNDAENNNDVSLVKLGCELHGPDDMMIINRDNVSFWENLKAEGRVSTAIAQWNTENPDGQVCADAPSGSQGQTPAPQAGGTPQGSSGMPQSTE